MSPDDQAVPLPAIITSIRPQAKRREHVSLFHEERFLIDIHRDGLLRHHLAVGSVVTELLYHQLQTEEQHLACRTYLLNLLARRAHTRCELEQKAGRKNFHPDVLRTLLDTFEEKKWIDDRRFAFEYANEKAESTGWGPRKIAASLRRRGVAEPWISEAVDQVFSQRDPYETLKRLVLKRRGTFLREAQTLARKKKIFNYLRNKGFSSDTLMEYLDRLLQALE